MQNWMQNWMHANVDATLAQNWMRLESRILDAQLGAPTLGFLQKKKNRGNTGDWYENKLRTPAMQMRQKGPGTPYATSLMRRPATKNLANPSGSVTNKSRKLKRNTFQYMMITKNLCDNNNNDDDVNDNANDDNAADLNDVRNDDANDHEDNKQADP